MSRFDFSSFDFFGNNTSKKNADKRRRGRQCRIEELEGREMLSVSPWALANDQIDYLPEFVQTETPQLENDDMPATILGAQADLALPTQAQGASTKVLDVKASVAAGGITITGSNIGENTEYAVTVNGEAVAAKDVSYIKDASGSIKAISVMVAPKTKVTEVGIKSDSAEESKVTFAKAVKVPNYAAIKAKADTKGTIAAPKGNKTDPNKTATTVDSVTLTWVAGRPAGETITMTVKDATKGATWTRSYTASEVADKIVYHTDAKGNLLATLKIDGLQAGTKYNVEITHAGGGTLKKPTVTAKITTAKWAAPKPNVKTLVVGADDVKVDVTVPAVAKRTKGATYDQFAIYVQDPINKKERIFLGIVHAGADSTETVKKLTLSAACFANLPVDAAKGYTLFVRAITIGDGVGSVPIANKSLEGKLAVKKGDVSKVPNGAMAMAALITKNTNIPKFKTVTVESSSVTVTWDAVPGATEGYQVRYRKLGADGKWGTWSATPIDVAAETATATVSGLDENTQYEFQVRVGGTTPGTWSLSAFKTTQEEEIVVTPLATPTGLAVSGTPEVNAVTLTWNAVTDATGYEVQYKLASDTAWTTAAGTITGTTTTITGLIDASEYDFQVRTVKDTATSNWSASIQATTMELMDAPGGLAVSGLENHAATIDWDSVEGATSYALRYKLASQPDVPENWTTIPNAVSGVKVEGLSANSDYEFQVQALKDGGASVWSDSTTAKTENPNTPLANIGALTLATDLAGTTTWYDHATDTMTVTFTWSNSVTMPPGTEYQLMYRLSNELNGNSKWRPFPSNYPGDVWVNDDNGWTKPEVSQSVIDNIRVVWGENSVTIIGLPTARGISKSTNPDMNPDPYPQYFWVVATAPGYTNDLPAEGSDPGNENTRAGWSNRVTVDIRNTEFGRGYVPVTGFALHTFTFTGSTEPVDGKCDATLSWSTVGHDAGDTITYTLQYKKASDTEWMDAPGTIASSATSHTINGLDFEATYNFKLTATVNDVSDSSETTKTLGSKPVEDTMGLSAVQVSGSKQSMSGIWGDSDAVTTADTWDVRLRWNNISDEDVTWQIYHRISSTGNYESVGYDNPHAIIPEWVDGKWQCDFRVAVHETLDHIFIVVARDAEGNVILNSLNGTEVPTGSLNNSPGGDCRIRVGSTISVPAPTWVTATRTWQDPDNATITWNAPTVPAGVTITGYELRYRVSGGPQGTADEFSNWATVGGDFVFEVEHRDNGTPINSYGKVESITDAGGQWTATISGLNPSQVNLGGNVDTDAYVFYVRAIFEGGTSAISGDIRFGTNEKASPAPLAAPASVSINEGTGAVAWDKSQDATDYEIQWFLGAAPPADWTSAVAGTNGGTATVSDSGYKIDTTGAPEDFFFSSESERLIPQEV